MTLKFVFSNKWNWLLILIVSVLLIGVIAYLGIKSNNEIHDIVQDQYTQQQLLSSKQMSAGMEEFLNQKTINIEILAEYISDTQPDTNLDDFKDVYIKSRGIYAIQYINESGVVSMGYPQEETPVGYDLYENDQEWAFEKVKSEKISYVARPSMLFEGGLGVTVWSPVYEGDEFKGTILAIIKLSEITDRFLDNEDSTREIYIVDNRGTILYDSSDQYEVGKICLEGLNETNPQLLQILYKQLNGTEGIGYYFEANTSNKKLIAYSPIRWRSRLWSIAVTSPVSDVDALIYSVYVKQGQFIGVSAGFILLVSLSIILLLTRWNKSLELEVNNKTRELKNSNELLLKANKKLLELDKLKSDFVSMVSHELKTPLTAIRSASDFLLLNSPDQNANKEMLELITKNVGRQTRIVDDLLDISRIENGRVTYRKEVVDLYNIINSAANTIKNQAEEKGLELTIDVGQNLTKIKADRDKLIQVFVNLLGNALKFTPQGGKVEVIAREFEKSIEIHVKDNGIGIPPNRIDKIFDKFYQIDSTSTRSYSGSGLGLAIVKGIIEGHGGTIRVESTLGNGSTFIVTFNK